MQKERTSYNLHLHRGGKAVVASQQQKGTEAGWMAVQKDQENSSLSPDEGPVSCPLRLGEILIKHGLITDAQLQEALHRQKTLKTYKPLGQILVDQQVLTAPQLTFYMEKYRKQLQ